MALDFIDPWHDDWWTHLEGVHRHRQDAEQVHLLIDSAFSPGLHLQLERVGAALSYLFDGANGDPASLREMSPLLCTFDPSLTKVRSLLEQCSGAPMLSAIVTTETRVALTERLRPWCVVHVDEQWFNFRFPDTRRLTGIHQALTAEQKGHMTGPATAWHLLNRAGQWSALDVTARTSLILHEVKLSDEQFADIMHDAASDEILFKFMTQGKHQDGQRSALHAQVDEALRIARRQNMDEGLHLAWCDHWLELSTSKPHMTAHIQTALSAWTQENTA